MSWTAPCTQPWTMPCPQGFHSEAHRPCRSCAMLPTAARRHRTPSAHHPSTVAARSILDSYRASQQQTAERGDADGADDAPCSTECVLQIYTAAEFDEQLAEVPDNMLVVVDFYRTACGSCKYIQPGFAKICKNSGDHHAPVVFLKHNILDEYDEETDLAHRLEIKAVPQFDFYKGGELVERFATRDKARIAEAINKHAGEGTVELSEITRSAV